MLLFLFIFQAFKNSAIVDPFWAFFLALFCLVFSSKCNYPKQRKKVWSQTLKSNWKFSENGAKEFPRVIKLLIEFSWKNRGARHKFSTVFVKKLKLVLRFCTVFTGLISARDFYYFQFKKLCKLHFSTEKEHAILARQVYFTLCLQDFHSDFLWF